MHRGGAGGSGPCWSILPSRLPVAAARLTPLGSVPVLLPGLIIPGRRRRAAGSASVLSPLRGAMLSPSSSSHGRLLLPAVPAGTCPGLLPPLPGARVPAAGTARLSDSCPGALPCIPPAPVGLSSPHSFTWG